MDRPGRLGLAVFTTEGCHLCRALEPALEALARDPLVAVEIFDEVADAARLAAARRAGLARSRSRWTSTARCSPRARSTPRATRERPRHGGAAAGGGRRWLSPGASPTSSRAALAPRVPRPGGGALLATAGAKTVGSLVSPGEAEAFHFCGHIYTTDSCPHPTGLPRIDASGFPLRARDGKPVDDLGRRVDGKGRPVDESGALLTDPDGRPAPAASRTKVCERVGDLYGFSTQIDGAWYRCCGGHVRKLVDCCSLLEEAHQRRRLAGRATATGAATSSASCTSRRRCRVDRRRGLAGARGLRRRPHRHVVAVRVLDDRDDRPAAG